MKKKKSTYYVVIVAVCFIVICLVIFAVDLYLHHHLNSQWGYNYKGYRGELAESDYDLRIACFGGSTTYGYGILDKETWPFSLQKLFKSDRQNISVINLGANGQGMYGIKQDIDFYDYLGYDVAIIYNGYNDLNPEHLQKYSFRGNDLIFKYLGYKPILPLYIKEKITHAIQRNDQNEKITFNSNGSSSDQDHLFDYITSNEILANQIEDDGNIPYQEYTEHLQSVFNILLNKNKKVFFVCPPKLDSTVQQQMVRKLIKKNYTQTISYINSGDAIDLSNDSMCYDGMHLTKSGNFMIAQLLKSKIGENIKMR